MPGPARRFTISALYLRLVLGHGGEPSGFGRELLPPQILVVTFTDAATKELRERIRTRLAEAARYFRDETSAPDGLIADLRNEYPPEQWPRLREPPGHRRPVDGRSRRFDHPQLVSADVA